MGFFSWSTQDTDESIPNAYCGTPQFTVYMHDDKGNVWEESAYEGYGIFGGKDYYELLAEMNGREFRDEGIALAFDSVKVPMGEIKYPNLTRGRDWSYTKDGPPNCEYQGYFYEVDDND